MSFFYESFLCTSISYLMGILQNYFFSEMYSKLAVDLGLLAE